MGKSKLQSYDIASYDIQIDYDKKITPIERKIQTLEKRHHQKSDRAHKAFLKKQKSAEKNITTLREKEVVRDQKLDTAVENKVERVNRRIEKTKEDYLAFVQAKQKEMEVKTSQHQKEIDTLKENEQKEIEEIKDKYKQNIASYVEKLDIYNTNYEENISTYQNEITTFLNKLDTHQDRIASHKQTFIKEIDEKNTAFNELIASRKDKKNIEYDTFIKQSMSYTNRVRQDANKHIHAITEFIDSFNQVDKEHYNQKIEILETYIDDKNEAMDNIIALVDKDLENQLAKLEEQKEALKDSNNKKAIKNVDMKIALFQTRAKTTKHFETVLKDHTTAFLNNEIERFKLFRNNEKINWQKLRVFLEMDQQEVKDFAEYYDATNHTLLETLKAMELSQIEATQEHETRRKTYLETQLKVYESYQKAILQLNQTHLDDVTENYQKMDEINQFLDTAEPNKEIEINKLKQRLEIKETNQRYALKYAKQQHDIDLIKTDYDTLFKLEAIERDQTLAKYEQEIDELYNQRDHDRETNQAKLQFNIAEENHKVLMNNRKLEQRLLESQYQTKKETLNYQKEIAKLDSMRENALEQKEVEYEIKKINNEVNYKIEVINKGLEEDLLKHEENLTKLRNEINAYKVNFDTMIKKKESEITEKKQATIDQFNDNLAKIDDALNREIKAPQIRLEESKHLIETRLDTFNEINVQFVTMINQSIEPYKNTDSVEKARVEILKDQSFKTHVLEYITSSYQVLKEAITFMHEVALRQIDNKIANTRDSSTLKKLKKQRQKAIDQNKHELNNIDTAATDYQAVINSKMQHDWKKFKKTNIDSNEQLIEQTTLLYNTIFDTLKKFQENIIKETKLKYQPLTETDQKIIDYAKSSAQKAKAKIKEKLQESLAPLDETYKLFVKEKSKQQEKDLAEFYESRDNVKATIQHLRNDALSKVKAVNEDKASKLAPKKQAKDELETSLETDIVQRKSLIDEKIQTLTNEYESNVSRLKAKNSEAQTILNYEENIYKMALESAKSRLTDNNEKTKNAYRAKMQQLAKKQDRINTSKKAQKRQIKDDLKDKSQIKDIEHQVDIKQQIQDVKHRIDQSVHDKQEILLQLKQHNQTVLQAAEDTLYNALQNTKNALRTNLDNYLSDCETYLSHYDLLLDKDKTLMQTNLERFRLAFNDVQTQKHNNTKETLKKTNESLFGKED
ncbi:MAG: hypothetical protein K9L26_04770 [Candidatus Izimaplasma sp.]|nr:hypothetical protein [Candidatus Izimaplasma bacterium]